MPVTVVVAVVVVIVTVVPVTVVVVVGAYWSSGLNVGFWSQRLTIQIPTSVCCVLEQETLSALLQSTQL